MKCDRCHVPILAGEEREFSGEILCEDCYMDALSPVRACDPWAVHSAKSLQEKGGAALQLNPVQRKIMALLRETGGMEFGLLAERMAEKPADLEREIASLRHMEQVRGELKEGKRIIRPW